MSGRKMEDCDLVRLIGDFNRACCKLVEIGQQRKAAGFAPTWAASSIIDVLSDQYETVVIMRTSDIQREEDKKVADELSQTYFKQLQSLRQTPIQS